MGTRSQPEGVLRQEGGAGGSGGTRPCSSGPSVPSAPVDVKPCFSFSDPGVGGGGPER